MSRSNVISLPDTKGVSNKHINELLARRVLFCYHYFTVDYIAQQVVEPVVIVQEQLEMLQTFLCKFHLELEYRPYVGYRIIGSEWDRRRCFVHLSQQFHYTCQNNVRQVQDMITTVEGLECEQARLKISYYIAITLERITYKRMVGGEFESPKNVNFLSLLMSRKIQRNFGVILSKYELHALSAMLK